MISLLIPYFVYIFRENYKFEVLGKQIGLSIWFDLIKRYCVVFSKFEFEYLYNMVDIYVFFHLKNVLSFEEFPVTAPFKFSDLIYQ